VILPNFSRGISEPPGRPLCFVFAPGIRQASPGGALRLAIETRGGISARQARKKKKLSASRGEGSVVGLQLRVRFVPAALLAMLRTALALQCVSKARDWTGHVDR
jgi:hypothetical protein